MHLVGDHCLCVNHPPLHRSFIATSFMPLLVGLLGITTACFDAEAKWHLLPAQACLAARQLASVFAYFCWLCACGPLPLILFVWYLSVHYTAQDKCLPVFTHGPLFTEFMLQAKLLSTPKQGQSPLPQKAFLTLAPLMPAFQWPLPQKLVHCLQHRLLQQLRRQTLPVSPRWQICQNMANLLLTMLLLHRPRSGSLHVSNTSAGDIQKLCSVEMKLHA